MDMDYNKVVGVTIVTVFTYALLARCQQHVQIIASYTEKNLQRNALVVEKGGH